MGTHDSPWVHMTPYGFIWVGYFWLPMSCYGSLWVPNVFLWLRMGSYDSLLFVHTLLTEHICSFKGFERINASLFFALKYGAVTSSVCGISKILKSLSKYAWGYKSYISSRSTEIWEGELIFSSGLWVSVFCCPKSPSVRPRGVRGCKLMTSSFLRPFKTCHIVIYLWLYNCYIGHFLDYLDKPIFSVM